MQDSRHKAETSFVLHIGIHTRQLRKRKSINLIEYKYFVVKICVHITISVAYCFSNFVSTLEHAIDNAIV